MNVKQEFLEPQASSVEKPNFAQPADLNPSIPSKTHRISLDEYKFREKRCTDPNASSDPYLKKIVLAILRNYRSLWERLPKYDIEKWMTVGVEVFERTGIIVSVPHLRKMLISAKFGMRRKIHSSIKKHKMTREQTNTFMWNWEFYGHFIYYREMLLGYEARLRGEEYDGEEDDDDIIFDGMKDNDTTNNRTNDETEQNSSNFNQPQYETYQDDINVEEIPYSEDQYPPPAHHYETYQEPPQSKNLALVPPLNNNMENPRFPQAVGGNSDIRSCSASSSQESFQVKPVLKRPATTSCNPTDEDPSVSHIAQQASRVFSQYPDKANLIRKALFSTILAFDDEDADYTNLGDLFSDLAAQSYAKKSRKQ